MKQKILPLLFVFVLILSACGETGPAPERGNGNTSQPGLTDGNSYLSCPGKAATTAARPEKGSVNLKVAIATSSPGEENLVKQNIQKFEATHPNITVDLQNIGTGYADKMRANVASKNVPDAFYLQMEMASEYIPANKVLNLSPYMVRDNVLPDDYFPALMRPFSCKDGQVYGIPKDWNTLGVFYNKTLFQKAGVALPTADWTWDDMRSTAKAVTKEGSVNDKIYGITLDPDPSRWLAFLFSNEGSVLNEDGTKAAFNTNKGIESLDFYTSFQKDGSSVPPREVGASWAGESFGKERAAMALEGGWLIPYLTAFYPNLQYDIAPLPKTPAGKRANLLYTTAWSGYSETEHPDATWQFIRYMTGEDAQKRQLDAGFALPSIKSLSNDPYFESHPGFKIMFDAAENGIADFYGPHYTAIDATLKNAIDEVQRGRSDSRRALRKAEQLINIELLSP